MLNVDMRTNIPPLTVAPPARRWLPNVAVNAARFVVPQADGEQMPGTVAAEPRKFPWLIVGIGGLVVVGGGLWWWMSRKKMKTNRRRRRNRG